MTSRNKRTKEIFIYLKWGSMRQWSRWQCNNFWYVCFDNIPDLLLWSFFHRWKVTFRWFFEARLVENSPSLSFSDSTAHDFRSSLRLSLTWRTEPSKSRRAKRAEKSERAPKFLPAELSCNSLSIFVCLHDTTSITWFFHVLIGLFLKSRPAPVLAPFRSILDLLKVHLGLFYALIISYLFVI